MSMSVAWDAGVNRDRPMAGRSVFHAGINVQTSVTNRFRRKCCHGAAQVVPSPDHLACCWAVSEHAPPQSSVEV